MRIIKLTSLCCLTILLAACGKTLPDLALIYQTDEQMGQERRNERQTPVILIPGLLGSRLIHQDTKEEAWPGSWTNLLFGEYDFLALDIDPETLTPKPSVYQPSGPTSSAFGFDVYGNIIRTLETVGRYKQTHAGSPITDNQRRYYFLSYDWRQDNIHAVRALDKLIKQIRLDYNDPNLKVDLIAHSMGGLIARYYVKYGTQDVLTNNDFPINLHGDSRIRRAVLLGTPNMGSLKALRSFIEGYEIGPNRVSTEVLATSPSAYQLFPHPLLDWIMTADGRPLNRDQFATYVWRRFQDQAACDQHLNVLERYFTKYLERARRFVWSLSVNPQKQQTRFIVFGSDCFLTPSRTVVEEIDGISHLRLYPDDLTNKTANVDYKKLMLDPGDGTVTKPSLLARQTLDPTIARHKHSHFSLAYSFFLCEDHEHLSGNITFQNNLLNILLER